jgi:cap2 methyltransferase
MIGVYIIIVLLVISISLLIIYASDRIISGGGISTPEVFKPLKWNELSTNFPYQDGTSSQNIHIGQRKLLMNEVYFLTKYGHLSDTIVYAGAAHGIHIPLLSELFPKHQLILYDSQPFRIKQTDRIKIYTGDKNGWFTNDVAKQYAGKSILFISDIRSVKDGMSNKEFEQRIDADNHSMLDWVNIMKPTMSMLKFRLPFTLKPNETYEYFDGHIDIQPWAQAHSAETRLITDGTSKKEWKMGDYENKMFYVNNIIRPNQKYDAGDLGIVNFDTAYEIYIWMQYFKKLGTSKKNMKKEIADVMQRANINIGRDLTGRHITPEPTT